MEPVDDRRGLTDEEVRGQTDLEDWVWWDCDLQTGEVDDEDSCD